MTPRQPRDLRERVIDPLRVESAAAFEERVFVAEVAMLRAAARDHDRVRHEVPSALDQIAAYRRQAIERAVRRRSIHARGTPGAEIRQERGERLLRRPETDRV